MEMEGTPSKGYCKRCNREFAYSIFNNGFNQSAHAYCNRCGMACILNDYRDEIPKRCDYFKRKKNVYKIIDPDVEQFLKYCTCGGEFKHDALPRCPHCHEVLEEFRTPYYETVTVMIEGNKISNWWKEDWKGQEILPQKKLGSKIKQFFNRNKG